MTTAMVTAALEATVAKTKPHDANPFRRGDLVVYPTHGVGQIDRVGFEEIAGHQLNLIHISFEVCPRDGTIQGSPGKTCRSRTHSIATPQSA